jgi:tripartite ATP-independent transporter DctM subunit
MITDPVAATLLISTFFVLILLRMPIAFALGVSSVVTAIYLNLPISIVFQQILGGMNVFALLAVPFFILAGEIMSQGGIARRLVALADVIIGRMRGGLGMVNILASMFFGGISGSSVGDTSSIGAVLIPMMKKKGYDAEFATTVTIASSVQGILIPPSHNMIIFSLVAGGVSVGRLFLAGLVPGVLLGVALMIYTYIVAVRRRYPAGEPVRLRDALLVVRDSVLGLLTVMIVVVGVVAGVFTATESAAIAVVYAFLITFFVIGEIPVKQFGSILANALKILAIVLILIGTASAFGWMMTYLNVPKALVAGITAISDNPIIIILILNVIMLFLGTFMDMSSLILITTPILLPIAHAAGMATVHFGIVMMLNLGIGLLTPPVGGTLFVGSAIGGVSIERLSVAMLPFYTVMIFVLLLITYVPWTVMYLPNLLMP